MENSMDEDIFLFEEDEKAPDFEMYFDINYYLKRWEAAKQKNGKC